MRHRFQTFIYSFSGDLFIEIISPTVVMLANMLVKYVGEKSMLANNFGMLVNNFGMLVKGMLVKNLFVEIYMYVGKICW